MAPLERLRRDGDKVALYGLAESGGGERARVGRLREVKNVEVEDRRARAALLAVKRT